MSENLRFAHVNAQGALIKSRLQKEGVEVCIGFWYRNQIIRSVYHRRGLLFPSIARLLSLSIGVFGGALKGKAFLRSSLKFCDTFVLISNIEFFVFYEI